MATNTLEWQERMVADELPNLSTLALKSVHRAWLSRASGEISKIIF